MPRQPSLFNDYLTVILMQPGIRLRASGGSFVIDGVANKPIRIPAFRIEQFMLTDQINVTTGALTFAMKCEIPVTFLNHHGNLLGHVIGPNHHDATVRLRQFAVWQDPVQSLSVAAKLVGAKIRQSVALMQQYQGNYPNAGLATGIQRLEALTGSVTGTTDVAQLRGYEGTAARIYFEAFGCMIRNDQFSFPGRNRRPPRDPVNALLSFGYTILAREASAHIQLLGLDPYVGYLHELKSGRPALALDLMEPLRPLVIDRLVLRLLNRRQVNMEHFETVRCEDNAVYLNSEGRRTFFAEYERWMRSCHGDDPRTPLLCPRSFYTKQFQSFREAILADRLQFWQPADAA